MIRLYWFNRNKNFGDQLSPMVCRALSGRKVAHTRDFKQCDLIAIGSVLQMAAQSAFTGTIWGSGFIDEPDQPTPLPNAKVAAVRGRLTGRILGQDNVPVGDPGLLGDRFYKAGPERHRLGIVPHYEDADNPLVAEFAQRSAGATVINVMDDVHRVIRRIGSCDAIISSSLHGLILADSLGIPNGWLNLSDRVLGAGFKFRDYYSAFGIDDPMPIQFDHASTVQSVTQQLQNYRRDGLEQIKANLQAAYPFPGKRRWFMWW